MPVSTQLVELGARCGTALQLRRDDVLRIVDPRGEQVADVALFGARDVFNGFSPGRTIDYNESLRLRVGDTLFSHRSAEMARVVEDTAGVHDILLAPCSEAMFERRGELSHRSCHGNLATALRPYGIPADMITATVNVFMRVDVGTDGGITIGVPSSSAGDSFALQALDDLVVGISACSSELTNNGRCKPMLYEIRRAARSENE